MVSQFLFHIFDVFPSFSKFLVLVDSSSLESKTNYIFYLVVDVFEVFDIRQNYVALRKFVVTSL